MALAVLQRLTKDASPIVEDDDTSCDVATLSGLTELLPHDVSLEPTTKRVLAQLWKLIVSFEQAGTEELRGTMREAIDCIVLRFDHQPHAILTDSSLRDGVIHFKEGLGSHPTPACLRIRFAAGAG